MPDNDSQTVGERISEAVAEGRLPPWAGQERPIEGRDQLRARFHDSHDIAGAAEALHEEGVIVYDQAKPADLRRVALAAGLPVGNVLDEDAPRFEQELSLHFIAGGAGSDFLYGTRGNCYEFVHLAAFVAADEGARPTHQRDKLDKVIDPKTRKRWVFPSIARRAIINPDIPRGQVIAGCVPNWLGGQGPDGTYHFAVSLGDGWVLSNHGNGVQKERFDDVFGGVSCIASSGA